MHWIYKYYLHTEAAGERSIKTHKGARLLAVQPSARPGQADTVAVWAGVDDKAPEVERIILAVETGDNMPDLPYLGTVQTRQGCYVLHFFDVGER